MPTWPLAIFYDGACSVCSREIEHYLGLPHGGRLTAIDISRPGFVAADFGLDAASVHQRMHVRDRSGTLWVGVDAFPVIWAALPGRGYAFLAWLVRLPGVHLLARLGYAVFARNRRFLPKRSAGCRGNTCDRG